MLRILSEAGKIGKLMDVSSIMKGFLSYRDRVSHPQRGWKHWKIGGRLSYNHRFLSYRDRVLHPQRGWKHWKNDGRLSYNHRFSQLLRSCFASSARLEPLESDGRPTRLETLGN